MDPSTVLLQSLKFKPMQKNDIHNLQIKTEQRQVQTEV